MSCCWSKKLFGRRSKREDRYIVKDDENQKKEDDGEAPKEEEAPKFSWERREKVNPEDFLIKDQSGKVFKKEGNDGGPMQIENCTDSTILFLQRTSQIIIDDCRDCVIVVGPSEGSVFIRDCSNCIILTSCQQLRTRDCNSIRIGILCPTEPIVENSTDVYFYSLAMFYPGFKDQLHSAGLRPFTNRILSAHDFTPSGADGKANLKVFANSVEMPQESEAILMANGVLLSSSPNEFLPRFSAIKEDDPTFLYILGKAEPVDQLGDKAIELLHAISAAQMKIVATHDVITKNIDAKMIPFAEKAERMILFQLSGNLAQLKTEVEFDVINDDDLEPLAKLLVHLAGGKSG